MPGNIFWGILLVLLGVLFLADHAGFLDLDFEDMWPLILVFIGLYLILKAAVRRPKKGVSAERRE